jgi:hypothetical protein
MRLSRIITAFVAGLAVAGAPTAAGAAQPYPPQPPALTATVTTVGVGENTTLIGTGFGANELVRLDFSFTPLALRAPGGQPAQLDSGGTGAMAPIAAAGVLADEGHDGGRDHRCNEAIPSITVRADADGRFTRVVSFRCQGRILVTATGLTTGRTASVTITVIKHQPGLPVTGSNVGQQIALGGGLLVVGVLLVLMTVAWRRRNRRHDGALGSMS